MGITIGELKEIFEENELRDTDKIYFNIVGEWLDNQMVAQIEIVHESGAFITILD